MRNSLPLRSEAGFSLSTIMLAVGILGITAMGLVSWSKQQMQVNRQINVRVVADQIKQRLVGLVISPDSWNLTSQHNESAFHSLPATSPGNANDNGNGNASPGNPHSVTYPNLNIYSADLGSTPYYRASNSNAGFDLHGNPCDTFNADQGNDACPFHYDIRLKSHSFVNGNWVDTLHFALTYRPANQQAALNTSSVQYSFDLARNLDQKSAETSCVSINGQYQTDSGNCSVKLTAATDCATSAKAYRGPTGGTNTVNCETPRAPATVCGNHMAIRSFSSSGNPECAGL